MNCFNKDQKRFGDKTGIGLLISRQRHWYFHTLKQTWTKKIDGFCLTHCRKCHFWHHQYVNPAVLQAANLLQTNNFLKCQANLATQNILQNKSTSILSPNNISSNTTNSLLQNLNQNILQNLQQQANLHRIVKLRNTPTTIAQNNLAANVNSILNMDTNSSLIQQGRFQALQAQLGAQQQLRQQTILNQIGSSAPLNQPGQCARFC